MKALFAFLFFVFCALRLAAQAPTFTKDDTLRGSITPERAWWDLRYYDLRLRVDPTSKSISGSNTIEYMVLADNRRMQLDLQPPLRLERAEQDGDTLPIQKIGKNAYWIQLKKPQVAGARNRVTVHYSGIPREAVNAPWDGGFSWDTNEAGTARVSTSCQGLGASVWWPCKDHLYDEPDSQSLSLTLPRPLFGVSNGRLRRVVENADSSRTFQWFVSNPISNYTVNISLADYVHFSDTLQGEKGVLNLDYYVYPENLEKAKEQFKQVKLMLRAFEYWFGPYPFYEDGYKLVETPFLGMEHQSAISYGNGYKNGYLGFDLSSTGWGGKWDYIIIHESGHEWFANNITYKDIADMWVHEGFASYSEGLFTEYYYGKQAGNEYIRGARQMVENRAPIIGIYNVNMEGSGDMYHKAANMLHTIRQLVDDDEKWRSVLRGLNREFYHKTVTTAEIEEYMSKQSGIDLKLVFDQYLRSTRIPVLEYRFKNDKLEYRWAQCASNFNMAVKVMLQPGKYRLIHPETAWKAVPITVTKKQFKVDEEFYVESKEIN